MKQVVHDLITTKYTKVMHKENFNYNAPHEFTVESVDKEEILSYVVFQQGPIKEAGVNGACNEDLIAMVICRLQHFQESPFACEENQQAIFALENALQWMRQRTNKREARGVEGTHTV